MGKITFSISSLLLLISFSLVTVIATADELDEILEGVRQNYDVKHLSNSEYQALSKNNLIVFDVRKQKEYDVSHLNGAIQLDPSTSANDFFTQYADQLRGKTAVFYCSVGQRSSRMLAKLQERLNEMGITEAYNLEGGAFKWHNDKYSLSKNGETTRKIHPYNAYWGRLIEDKQSIKY